MSGGSRTTASLPITTCFMQPGARYSNVLKIPWRTGTSQAVTEPTTDLLLRTPRLGGNCSVWFAEWQFSTTCHTTSATDQALATSPSEKLSKDPHGKNSAEALPVQMADVAAYFLYQRYAPGAFVRRKRADRYFDRLTPILNKWASRLNGMGIVEL